MKLLICLILTLTITQVTFSQEVEGDLVGGWSPANVTECLADEDCKKVLRFGAQFLINQGIQADVLPDTAWTVNRLISLEEQVVSGTNYRFHAQLIAPTGQTFGAIFVVWWQPWTNTLEVISIEYYYEDETSGESEVEYEVNYHEGEGWNVYEIDNGVTELIDIFAGWNEVNVEQAENDPNTQTLLIQGAQYTINQGEAHNTLPSGNWTLESTNAIWREDVSGGVNWRFDVVATNGNQTWADLDYIVYQSSNGRIEIVSWAVNQVWAVL